MIESEVRKDQKAEHRSPLHCVGELERHMLLSPYTRGIAIIGFGLACALDGEYWAAGLLGSSGMLHLVRSKQK